MNRGCGIGALIALLAAFVWFGQTRADEPYPPIRSPYAGQQASPGGPQWIQALPRPNELPSVEDRSLSAPQLLQYSEMQPLESDKADPKALPKPDGDKTKPPSDAAKKSDGKEKPKKWYEKYGVRGYTQIRSNEALWHMPGSAPVQHVGDRSVGDAQNFFVRRARLIIFGDVNDHVSIYLQPDFAIQPPGSPDGTHFVQLRDWYADVFLDCDKVHRFRIGQSKIPYGWENMQSSSNRLPLDRNDALNSAARNERDLGVFYYWTPSEAQRLFRFVLDEGLKGSGNYGVLGLGAYNGQGGSFVEQNNNLHLIGRLTVPYQFSSGQVIEAAVQAYTGRFTVLSSPIRALGVGPSIRPAGTLETGNREGLYDARVAWTGVIYPQPLGFQAEWTIGRGPRLNDAQNAVIVDDLTGGYAMTMYRLTHRWGTTIPFFRWAYYRGGYKSERNAPFARINEFEVGYEWQFSSALELVMMYTWTNRTNTTAVDRLGTIPYRQFVGNILRMQVQFNY